MPSGDTATLYFPTGSPGKSALFWAKLPSLASSAIRETPSSRFSKITVPWPTAWPSTVTRPSAVPQGTAGLR